MLKRRLKYVLLTLLLLMTSACGSSLKLYSVNRTLVERCEIRPDGEFCDDVGAAPSDVETIAVEIEGDIVSVYFGDAAWVTTNDGDEYTITKEERSTRAPGPCTQISTRTLRFRIEGSAFNGTLEVASRVEGNELCGETPRGSRQRFQLSGEITNAI